MNSRMGFSFVGGVVRECSWIGPSRLETGGFVADRKGVHCGAFG